MEGLLPAGAETTIYNERILTMPRGLPDYGIPIYGLASQYVDMATLFLAQTGFTSVDGTGRIFYADNFHGGLGGFEATASGDAKTPYPATTHCYVPPLSLGFNPGTVNGNGTSWVRKWMAIPDTERMGLEIIVAVGTDHPVKYDIALEYCYRNGSSYQWSVIWRTDTGLIQIRSGGKFVTIDTYLVGVTGWYFAPIKLVGNVLNGLWERLLIGNKGYNLSAYTPSPSSLSTQGMLMIQLRCDPVQVTTSGDYGRIGYMILTVDEP